ncbi:MAG: ABC transporter permease [Clostridia bacterium]|jgi:simple sugar transport system permease protein|nr:ABC transporter permease [Clostridia bacterium]MBQ5956908.1 ABC transporter permease [Clostridia bacterium]MBQ6004097.1 ABC transporter permease [Clostridia bacterium]MBR6134948.1 ABC transporter permease [Clostridia bacterium]MBR6822260.1 ABC transporter permease [Clostridia bacterium]
MNNKHTPLFHIRKRGMLKWYQVWKIRLIAILLALIVDAVITTLVTGLNPIDVYATIFKGSFGTPRKFWVMMQNVAIMLCVSIAITPAYKMRFWNVGGEGQILIGALVSAACMILLGNKLPSWLIIVLSFMLSTLAGAIWAFIPAFFKAKWNTNETLFTLMMNYVATQLVAFFIIKWEVPKGAGKIGIINQSTESGWLPTIFDNKYLLNILIVFVLTILVHIYLRYSKHGYELSVVGESERTARYIGLNVEKVIMRTLLLSGALCGIAGFLLVAGTNHTVTTTIAGGRGFTAVMVAWLANFKPLGMIITSFLIIFMDRGAGDISSNFGLNASFSDIITGIILFFIIASEFFIRYEIVWRKKENKEEPVQEAPIDETAKATLDEADGKEE